MRIDSTGLSYWSTFGDIKVITSFELTKFPYDKQTINMTFGSWIYTDNKLKVRLRDPPFLIKAPNSWSIESIEWSFGNYYVDTLFQEHPSGNYYRYTFVVELLREGGVILIAVVIPGALITFLGLLYILIPKGTGERTAYLATILLTEIMFLVMITSLVPMAKQVPMIGWLFLGYTILLAVLTVAVLGLEKIHHEFGGKNKEKKS